MNLEHPDYHPPHVVHAHAPHGETLPPGVEHVHPNVLREKERQRDEELDILVSSPWLTIGIGILILATSAYFNFKLMDGLGWWVIIPPVIVLPMIVTAGAFTVDVLIYALTYGLTHLLFRAHFDAFFNKVGVIGEVIGFKVALFGIPVALLILAAKTIINAVLR